MKSLQSFVIDEKESFEEVILFQTVCRSGKMINRGFPELQATVEHKASSQFISMDLFGNEFIVASARVEASQSLITTAIAF